MPSRWPRGGSEDETEDMRVEWIERVSYGTEVKRTSYGERSGGECQAPRRRGGLFGEAAVGEAEGGFCT